jgi:hypothetical protein
MRMTGGYCTTRMHVNRGRFYIMLNIDPSENAYSTVSLAVSAAFIVTQPQPAKHDYIDQTDQYSRLPPTPAAP